MSTRLDEIGQELNAGEGVSMQEEPYGALLDAYQGNGQQEEPEEEGWLGAAARNVGALGARAAETVVGTPGGLQQLAHVGIGKVAGFIPGVKEDTVFDWLEKGRKLPTPSDVRESLTKPLTGEYFEPKGELSKIGHEVAEDVTALVIPWSNPAAKGAKALNLINSLKKIGKAFGAASGGQATKQTLKALGFGETTQNLAKLGTTALISIAMPGQAKKHAEGLMNEASEQAARDPLLESHTVDQLRDSVKKIQGEDWYLSKVDVPSKRPAREIVDEIARHVGEDKAAKRAGAPPPVSEYKISTPGEARGVTPGSAEELVESVESQMRAGKKVVMEAEAQKEAVAKVVQEKVGQPTQPSAPPPKGKGKKGKASKKSKEPKEKELPPLTATRLMQFKQDINEALRNMGAYAIEKRPDIRAAVHHLNRIKKVLDDALQNYGKKNKGFWERYQAANQAYAVTHRSSALSEFIREAYTGKNLSNTTKSLVGLGAVVGGASYFPAAAALAAGAAPFLAAAHSLGKIVYRMAQSPAMNKYYRGVIQEASKGNARAMTLNLQKLDEKVREQEREGKL